MGAISAGDQTLLENQIETQTTNERLYVWGFPQMWTGRVNDAGIVRGAQSVIFDGGTMIGGYVFAQLTKGLLVFFGSSAGEDDIGRRLLLSISGTATSGTLIVDWNDDVELSNNDYITIILLRPPWASLAWFAQASGFYKSGPPSGSGGDGIDYTDQNEEPPPHVVIGRCGVSIGVSPTVVVDATDSKAVATGATLSTYAWFAVPAGGVTFTSASSASTTVQLTEGVRYYLGCTITDSNGNSTTGYRPFIADDGTMDIGEFSRSPISEQYGSHVVNCSLTLTSPDVSDTVAIRPDTDWSDVGSGTLVIVTGEDHYGSTQKTITFRDDTRYTDRNNIVYYGFIAGETRHRREASTIQLSCASVYDFFLYSLSVTGSRAVAEWYQMTPDLMYVASLLFHLLYWHSTMLEISDWIFPWDDTNLRSMVDEWTEGNIFERARALAGVHGRLMSITATAQGEFFVEENINYLAEADRNAITTTLTLSSQSVMPDYQVKISHLPKISQTFVSGGYTDGAIGTFIPFLSEAHRVRRAIGIGSQSFERLMLPDQTEANRLCGRLQAVANREVVEIAITFSGIYRQVFSPADQQWTNTGTDLFALGVHNLRNTTDLDSLRMVPRRVTIGPPSDGYVQTNVVFEVEAPVGELSGRTVTLKDIAPYYVPSGASTEVFQTGDPPDALIAANDTNGVEVYIYDDASWQSRNTGLSGNALLVYDVKVVPFWWLFQNSSDPEFCMAWVGTGGGLYFTDDFGKSWQDRTPLAALDNPPAGVTPATVTYYSIDVFSDPTDINRVITAQCREEVAGIIHSWILISTNSGFNWTSSKRS